MDAVAPEPDQPRMVVAKGATDPETASAELPEEEAAALAGVGFEPTGVDVISSSTGMGVPELLPALALLELKG